MSSLCLFFVQWRPFDLYIPSSVGFGCLARLFTLNLLSGITPTSSNQSFCPGRLSDTRDIRRYWTGIPPVAWVPRPDLGTRSASYQQLHTSQLLTLCQLLYTGRSWSPFSLILNSSEVEFSHTKSTAGPRRVRKDHLQNRSEYHSLDWLVFVTLCGGDAGTARRGTAPLSTDLLRGLTISTTRQPTLKSGRSY